MNKTSKTLKFIGLASVCLWIIGSILLFRENNGKTIIAITAVVIIGGLYAQILKDRKVNSEN